MIKNVIFDMDGVLVDSENGIRTACAEVLRKYGANAVNEDFIPYTGMGERKFIGGVCEKYGIEYLPRMKEEAYARYGEIAGEYVVVYPGVRETVLALKELGMGIAVASAADLVKVEVNLGCLSFSINDFGAVVTGSDIERNKPAPDIFLKAAEKLGADPAACLVVEDAVAGVQAAKAAGMRCIAVLSTFPERLLLDAGADYIVDRTEQVPEVIRGIR